MSDNLKQFKQAVTEALVKYFSARDYLISHRVVTDKATGKVFRTWMDETLSDMKGEINLVEVDERGETVWATFTAESDDKVYTFHYMDNDTTIINILMTEALAA